MSVGEGRWGKGEDPLLRETQVETRLWGWQKNNDAVIFRNGVVGEAKNNAQQHKGTSWRYRQGCTTCECFPLHCCKQGQWKAPEPSAKTSKITKLQKSKFYQFITHCGEIKLTPNNTVLGLSPSYCTAKEGDASISQGWDRGKRRSMLTCTPTSSYHVQLNTNRSKF